MNPAIPFTEVNTSEVSLPRSRIQDHDFLKGVLVEVMIIYHSVGYFATNVDSLKYLDFVTGAFVFLSGSVVSQYYYQKYGPHFSLISRLFARSGKLIALFLVLNLGVHLVVRRNYNGAKFGLLEFYDGLFDVFIPGSKQLACFEILLPIAYTLILGAVLMTIARSKMVVALIVCLAILIAFFLTKVPFNLNFICVGLGGLVYGFYKRDRLSSPMKRVASVGFAIVCIAYMTIVAFIPKDNLIIYLIGVISVVECIRSGWEGLAAKGWFFPAIRLFGEYSLFGYLFQIFLLQVLFRFNGGRGSSIFTTISAILFVNFAVFFALKVLSKLRLLFRTIDIAYKTVFA